MAAIREDTPTRSLPCVGHSHWGVHLWNQLSDAGEVEVISGVDNSGGGINGVQPWSRHCDMERKNSAWQSNTDKSVLPTGTLFKLWRLPCIGEREQGKQHQSVSP